MEATGLKTKGVVPVPIKNACLPRPVSSGNSGANMAPARRRGATLPRWPNRDGSDAALPYFFSPGRKTRNGRLIVPVHARVKLLPPSVQVCVPLRSACRRTNAPLYFASY